MVGAAIGAAVSIGGSLIAGNSAAKGQKQAAATQMKMYEQTRSDLMPFMSTGTSALGQLAKLWGLGEGGTGVPDTAAMTSALRDFPGYQFMLDEGIRARDNSASARGMLLSGPQLREITQFGQDAAMAGAWTPYVSMLSGLASLGQNSAAMVGNNGAQAAAGIAKNQVGAGEAKADMWGNITNAVGQVAGGVNWGGGGSNFMPGEWRGASSGVSVGAPTTLSAGGLGGGSFV